jgi:5-methyltetrahydropteroyltriglutamate--homocysteine methyltransferase
MKTATLGYPRIGKNREVKKALEAFWSGKLEAESLLQTVTEVEEANWQTQLPLGIDRIGIGDATLYDHVLDWTVRLGLIPQRFQQLKGLARYFAMARGQGEIPALEMTKWFDTNYHYLVPEITADIIPQADFTDFIETTKRGQTILGNKAVPIILSPVTLLRLSRLEGLALGEFLSLLLPLYRSLLTELKALGIEEVQLQQISSHTKSTTPTRQFQQTEKTRDRLIHRTIEVFTPPVNIDSYWVGVNSVIKIFRHGTRGNRDYQSSDSTYYLSSLSPT